MLIAVPSGAGVALSVLSGNAGSLVGVAISASLLPPAVNCGLFWAVAAVAAITGEGFAVGYDGANGTSYAPSYSDDPSAEAFLLGLVSLTLTLVNIACIIVTGIAILKLKEVTPDKIPQAFSEFWKRDVRAHRDYYSTVKLDPSGEVGQLAGEDLLREAREVLGVGGEPGEGLAGTFLQSVFDSAQEANDRLNIREWVAHQPAVAPAQQRRRRRRSPRLPSASQEAPPRISLVSLSPVSGRPSVAFGPTLTVLGEDTTAKDLASQARILRMRRHLSHEEEPRRERAARKRSQTIDDGGKKRSDVV